LIENVCGDSNKIPKFYARDIENFSFEVSFVFSKKYRVIPKGPLSKYKKYIETILK